ncbi:MAG TPA: hypothetical protein DHV16_12010 [Nitrospiraceae bacterium]|nr:hypothetical protein [Nitrospirota bacterium]OGW20056.1 MAG: hypothetical protein A2Z82_00955 [Nitrospirae bacterium GWA2_46_11]OGW25018.1 MAG: hypothetical protein A2X55_06020 [Nitrospirae bacterium GWB2_47_37]HAK88933.1 hypothetical protein [Nitrospiraceae bacterium]HCZ12933.1 hypothetical protein [Nitrospiraceae bacterium]
MARRLIDVLRVLAKELIEKGYDADDAVKKISVFDIDFLTVKEELVTLELSRYVDEAELDTIRALLSYVLMKETELDTEEIYAFAFGKGRRITWS